MFECGGPKVVSPAFPVANLSPWLLLYQVRIKNLKTTTGAEALVIADALRGPFGAVSLAQGRLGGAALHGALNRSEFSPNF